MPVEPVMPQQVAATPAPPVQHKIAKPVVRERPPVPPQEAPPPSDAWQPEYLVNPRPDYPTSAKLMHISGTVLLLVTMDEAGHPLSVSVERSSGSGILDQAARKQVASRWRFKPGQASTVHVPVEFHLE